MSLTLGNSLVGNVSREVNSANKRISALSQSMSTGKNQLIGVTEQGKIIDY